jgi:hypothetical protein
LGCLRAPTMPFRDDRRAARVRPSDPVKIGVMQQV